MLKGLTKDDTTITPYVATKDWTLSNTANTDLVLAENGNPVAVEAVQYTFTTATPISTCNVATEQQSLDLVRFREGLKTEGLFYPDLDQLNGDGTYKRLVHAQVKTMFYNHYRDPTQMWGLERIDFDTSQTKKFLSDLIKLLDVPTGIFGDKMLEGSIQVIDDTLDNPVIITDDGHNNLFAGPNLFSKQQELGNHLNLFVSGSDSTCESYFNFSPPLTPGLTGSSYNIIGSFGSASLQWQDNDITIQGYVLEKSTDGINFSFLSIFDSVTLSTFDFPLSSSNDYFYRVFAFNVWGSSSYSNIVDIFVLDCSLRNSSGSAYTLGPYDTFECATEGSPPTGSNSIFGWSGPWEIRSQGTPDFNLAVSIDSMDDYLASSGSTMIGLSGGVGWASAWTGSM